MQMAQTKNKLYNLKLEITAARKRLNTLWDAKGYTDHEVLAAGIELDILINEYQHELRVTGYRLRVKQKPDCE